jgi:hypothetical protein
LDAFELNLDYFRICSKTALWVRACLSADAAARHCVSRPTCQPAQPPNTMCPGPPVSPSLSPLEPAARHGRATPLTPTDLGLLPTEHRPSVGRESPPLSALTCHMAPPHRPSPTPMLRYKTVMPPRVAPRFLPPHSLFFPGRSSTLTLPLTTCPPPATKGLRLAPPSPSPGEP